MIYNNYELGRNLGKSKNLMKDMNRTPDRFPYQGKMAIVYLGPDNEPAIIIHNEFWEILEKQTNTLTTKGGPDPEEEEVDMRIMEKEDIAAELRDRDKREIEMTSTDLKPILPLHTSEVPGPSNTRQIEIMSIGDTAKIARQLTEIIDQCKLYTLIKGRKYIHVEGWQALDGMLNVTAVIVEVHEGDDYFEATCQLFTSDKEMVGQGTSRCYFEEVLGTTKRWYDVAGNVNKQAVMSMAQTRAIGKANRNKYGWIIRLAGYEATPNEEMGGVKNG